jgi:hypothetical protein
VNARFVFAGGLVGTEARAAATSESSVFMASAGRFDRVAGLRRSGAVVK